jgi:hypothetical protein
MSNPAEDRCQCVGGISKAVALSAGPVPFLSSSPGRVCLFVSSDPTTRVTISDDPNVTDLAGVVLHPGNAPLRLRQADLGNWVNKQLWAIVAGAGTATIGVTEIVQP